MTVQRKFMSGSVAADTALGPRQIRVVASDATIDRAGDVLRPEGAELTRYMMNPVVLADHDPTKPIGTAAVEVKNGRVEAVITFAPEGVSAKADEYCGLAKAGVLGAVSVGFQPIDAEPMKGGGVFYKSWELMELSVVAVPCNPSAVVIERSATVTISAEEHAALKAAAEAPKKIVDDIRALAKSAPKGQRGMLRQAANLAEKAAGDIVTKEVPKLTRKGLYEVGWLASLLSELGWLEECVEWEAAYEEDGSPIPDMLADAMRQIGQILIAMTVEEVTELVAEEGADEAGEEMMTAKSVSKALTVKAGRVLSSKNEADLTAARDLIDNVVAQVATTEPETAKAARIREAEALRLLIA